MEKLKTVQELSHLSETELKSLLDLLMRLKKTTDDKIVADHCKGIIVRLLDI